MTSWDDELAVAQAAFHGGDADSAITIFERLASREGSDPSQRAHVLASLCAAYRAAGQSARSIDAACLLTMGDLMCKVEEHAAALSDEKWASPEAIATFAQHCRGRAVPGLARVAAAGVPVEGHDTRSLLNAAVELLAAVGDAPSRAILEDLANDFANLGDAARAQEVSALSE